MSKTCSRNHGYNQEKITASNEIRHLTNIYRTCIQPNRVQSRLATATTQSAKVRANPQSTTSTISSNIRLNNNNQTPCTSLRSRAERLNSAQMYSTSTANTPYTKQSNKTPLISSRVFTDRKVGTFTTQTPLHGRQLQSSKVSSRTVECAKSSVRRSIRLLNNKFDNEFCTPSANSRRQLFAVNGSKIPIYRSDLKQYPKSEGAHLALRRREEPSKVNGADRVLKNELKGTNNTETRIEMKTATKKLNKRRSTNRFSMSQIESSCLILTPKLMRQLMNSASKANEPDEAQLQNVYEEEEEEPIKVHSIKPSSLIKYLFSDKKKPLRMDLSDLAEEASKKLNLNESAQQNTLNECQSKSNETSESEKISEQTAERQQQAVKEEFCSQPSMTEQEDQIKKVEVGASVQVELENKMENQPQLEQNQEVVSKVEEDSQMILEQSSRIEKPQDEAMPGQLKNDEMNQVITSPIQPEPVTTINQMSVEPIRDENVHEIENLNPEATKTKGRRGKKAATNTKKKLEEIKANEINECSNNENASESEQGKPARVLTRAQRAKLNAQSNNC